MAAFLLDEKKMLNDSAFLHEQRLSSQYTRFLEKNPTFVTYWSVSNIESTADNGFQNTERVLGKNSPIKYKEIKDLPIYGIEQIMLSLQDEEQGLDGSYEGEGIILPNTVIPRSHDMFTINYLNQEYLFMVTEFAYDTIKSNNFYKINFKIRAMDSEVEMIRDQVTEKYNCIFTNIGTADKCLIKSEEVTLLMQLNQAYSSIAERYKLFFYDSKFNAFLFTDRSKTPQNVSSQLPRFYDRYLSYFINEHKLFNEKNNFDTFHLTVERTDHIFLMEYHDSIYRALEVNRRNLLKDYRYRTYGITDPTSIFQIYIATHIKDVILDYGNDFYVPSELLTKIASNDIESVSVMWQTIIQYFNGSLDSIYSFKIDHLEDYNQYMGYDFETYILVPILLFILRAQYRKFMAVN